MVKTPERMSISLVVQRASKDQLTPGDDDLHRWAESALQGNKASYEVTIRLVDEAESRQLNANYRKHDAATNVLSFPAGIPEDIQKELESNSGRRPLGDLVICVPVVNQEAHDQGKPVIDHWAHLVVHGTLHLLGHDHEEPEQAKSMEQLEKNILLTFGIRDPYLAG